MSEPNTSASPMQAAAMQMLSAQLPGIPARDLERFAAAVTRDEPYRPVAVPDAVPAGRVERRRHRGRTVYPGVERNYALYVPAQYDGSREAGLIVFQDGSRYLAPEADAARVLDALIAAGELPPVVALFVEPGEQGPGMPLYGGAGNRSLEYDSTGDAYVRFLAEELLPEALAGLRVSADARERALVGLSSGGMCAFNGAWERPDLFGKVLSHCGSFVDIRGGHLLAQRVRREDERPLRVFLQTGEHDLDIVFGDWQLANRQLASALAYRGYDHQLVVGEGGHSLKQGGALLADALRWLWRD